ncbi:elongation factor P hydroxylase [Gilvimarinus agarilyticus]|uniref:elongation factor P hydroxylase n=1 Tax=Gilvimarinus agarilyticus TaxID=679259 RepID=UPI000698334C|nr:elongation factor P hydroxylase [Gilvimarinus agarilyticus]
MTAVAPHIPPDCQHLVAIFDRCFRRSERTCLVGGADEPFYRAATGDSGFHQIEFSHDYFASALHEIAHWSVAGPARRRQDDYGYWYAPDGRTASQQAEFERVEVKPQALEWLFSEAAGVQFRVSADNLAQGLGPSETFKDAIHNEVMRLCREGVSDRVATFCRALLAFYRPGTELASLLQSERFARSSL